MQTGFYAEYELKDTTAMADSTPTTVYNQPFGDILRLKDNAAFPDYATLEEDYFLLDGSMRELPDEPGDIVYFSSAVSGEDGSFAVNPVIYILFTEKHSSVGLKFHFVGDYPLLMRVRWYGMEGALIGDERFEPDSTVYMAWKQVEDYMRIEIEFIKARPYRYVKLRYLEYGTDLVFGPGGFPVKDARLVEECDPLSDKISVNKLSYKVIDERDDFNVGNRAGLHKVMQPGQKMEAYEKVDGEKLLLGRFFLSGSGTESNITSVNCVDYKGLLDKNRFMGGAVYSGTPAGTVIDGIMSEAGISDYTVDAATRNTPLYGWLKIQTCRKALREVLFACGSVIDSSRSLALNIYRAGRKIETTLGRDRKFSTAVEYKEYISDVSIKFSVYTAKTEREQVFKGKYPAGTHTVELSEPASEMTASSGVILDRTDNYVTFRLDAPEEVTVSGYKYMKEDLTVTASVEKLQAGKSRNQKSFSCTLLNAAHAAERARGILDYYGLQLGILTKFLNRGDRPPYWSEVYNTGWAYGNYVAGMEKMTTDLTGGFISTAEFRGYYKMAEDFYYTGELFAGEDETV